MGGGGAIKHVIKTVIDIDGVWMDVPVLKSELPKGAILESRIFSDDSSRLSLEVQGPNQTYRKSWAVSRNNFYDVWRTPDYDWFLTIAELNGVDLMLEILEV